MGVVSGKRKFVAQFKLGNQVDISTNPTQWLSLFDMPSIERSFTKVARVCTHSCELMVVATLEGVGSRDEASPSWHLLHFL